MSWGYHLALDIARCRPETIRCSKHIASFTNELVKRIDMKAYGQPQIVMFGEGNKRGYTLIQLIETSNIAGHFCEETNDLYLDIFSCKPYDINEAIRVVNKYFSPRNMRYNYFERQAQLQ
jgi:S-adenosylmethionine/arginine decarboxylase-like enzyme